MEQSLCNDPNRAKSEGVGIIDNVEWNGRNDLSVLTIWQWAVDGELVMDKMEGVSWSGFNVLDSSETDRKCTVKIYHCGPIGIGHRHQLGIRPPPWSPRIVGIAENSQPPSCWASAWTVNTLSDGVEAMLNVIGYRYRQKTNQVQIERRFSVVVLQSRVVCDSIFSIEPRKCR